MTVSELVNQLGEETTKNREMYKMYKASKEREEALRFELIEKLAEAGLRSAKTNEYNAIITDRSDIVVTHEKSVLDWLREEPNIETDQYIGLKTTNFKTLARTLRKETGEIVPGTEVVIKESIMIKGVK